MLRNFLFIIVTTIFLIACSHTHKRKTPSAEIIYSQAIDYAHTVNINTLFVSGTHKAHFIVRSSLTADQKKIYRRLLDKTEKGDSTNNYGLTKSESATLSNMLYHPSYLSGDGEIAINDSENKIHFQGNGKLSVLDSLTIDLNDSSAWFGGNNLSIADTSNIYKISPDSDYLMLPLVYREIHTISWAQCPNIFILCIARLRKSGKTFLYLKGVEFKDGLPLDKLIEVTID